jgi:hypothetical protein
MAAVKMDLYIALTNACMPTQMMRAGLYRCMCRVSTRSRVILLRRERRTAIATAVQLPTQFA